MPDRPDQILGHAGLTGRQHVVRVPEVEEVEPREPVVQEPGPMVMPGNCIRVSQSPRAETCVEQGGSVFGPCEGLQDDGGCLLDIVRRAQEQGVEWKFEVRWDQWGNQSWRYAGPPLQ